MKPSPSPSLELCRLSNDVWRLRGVANRATVSRFYRDVLPDYHNDPHKLNVRVDELVVSDSSILALLVHWQNHGKVRFQFTNHKVIRLIKLYRLHKLFNID